MKSILPAVVLLSFFCSPVYCVAQETNSKTLLWRISGNGLAKPSYLYGTMHLKDRRLFFFGDSVYKNIEAADGFAMELDPNDMMDSVFSKISEGDTSTLIRKLLDEKKFKSVSKKLEKKFGMPADKISRKQLVAERENWYNNIRKSDDMRSVVDLYLYDLAHKQGKWVGGIEDVDDQFGIIDELGKDVNITEYVDDTHDEERKNYLDKMITMYAAEDIDQIDAVFSGTQSQKTKDLLLIKRNIKMASRMDSLAHIRNSFFAVGVAHLPGQTGLIHLLRERGFIVSPVFSSKKIAPEKYSYTAKVIPWVKFLEEDSAYTVEMPGKTSDLKVMQDLIKCRIYADLVSNIVYMTGFSFFSSDEKPEALTDRIVKSFLSKGFEKKEEKKISNRGNNGTEILAVMGKIYYRLQVFPFADKVFIAMAGGEQKDILYNTDGQRYFQSFSMNPAIAAKPNTWVTHHDAVKAFDISFPKKPGIDKLKNETVKNIKTTTYTALDIASNTYYVVVVSETEKGFIMSNDSILFNSKLNYYKENHSVINDVRQFRYYDNNAMSFLAQTSKDGLDYVTKIQIICRGNREYTVAVVTQKGKEDYPDITRFFRSFKLLPYHEAAWSITRGRGNAFSTWAPTPFEQQLQDTAGLTPDEISYALHEPTTPIQLISHDSNSAVTYNVNIHPVSKYFYAKNDSAFLAAQLETYFSDTSSYFAKSRPGHFDSLVYNKAITNGNVTGVEILVKNAANNYYKKVRILPHGDSSYRLFVMAPYPVITNENTNKFFEAFHFIKEDLPSTISKNKTTLILKDLADGDSTLRANALAALDAALFDTSDLVLLYKAYLKEYREDTIAYNNIYERIGRAINSVNDTGTIAFVRENYMSGTTRLPELKMGMLEMLAHQRNVEATTLMKQLLLKSPPVKGLTAAFTNELADSLLLCKQIFPEAASFFGDSLLGPSLLRLASQLTDSNMLNKDILLQHAAEIISTANTELVHLRNDRNYYAQYNEYITDVLAKINSKQTLSLLNSFVKTDRLEIKKNAILSMVKAGLPVPLPELHKIAADNSYRLSLYKNLKDLGRKDLYPGEFFNQQQFAEGYIYDQLMDWDANNIVCKIIAEKQATVAGKACRYFLFRVSFDYGEQTESHLAICGRFNMNKKEVEIKDDDLLVKIFYDDTFNAATVNRIFQDFIAAEK